MWRRVGVDIERIRPMSDLEAIAERSFSPHERQELRRLASGDRNEGFFNCWTRKEAFIKAVGEGLSHPLERFDVSLAPGEPARILRLGGRAGEHCGWRIQAFSPSPGFVAAIVIEAP